MRSPRTRWLERPFRPPRNRFGVILARIATRIDRRLTR